MTSQDNVRTLYTLADAIEDYKTEARNGERTWDNVHRLVELSERTTYHADGDRTKWCEGCGCGTRQERQWLYTNEDGTSTTQFWGPDEDETATPVWTCSNCDHSAKRLVQSDETRQRRSDKKLAEALAKIERDTAETLYNYGAGPKPFHMIEADGMTARQMLASPCLADDHDVRALYERDLAEWEAAKGEQS